MSALWGRYLVALWMLSSISRDFAMVDASNDVLGRLSPIRTALSGDVNISFHMAKHLVNSTAPRKLVVHVISDRSPEKLRTFKIPIDTTNLLLRLPCDLFDHPATYSFKYRVSNNGPSGSLSQTMTLTWGYTRIEAPRNHTTLTRFGSIWIYHDRACLARARRYRDKVNLYFVKGKERVLLTQRSVRKLRNGKQRGDQLFRIRMVFSCDLFDTEGEYYFEYVSGFNNSSLSRSLPVDVRWSKHGLHTPTQSIFPCTNSFAVSFTAPECHKTTDTIKVYEQLSGKYITERPALPGRTAVFFPCTLFHDYIKGYCFRYISISGLTGEETVQATRCVSTLGPGKSIYDGWSSWSFWNLCSSSCGEGRRYRYRFCLSLTTSEDKKKACVGRSVMTKPCVLRPCPETRNKCSCGCRMTAPEGMITSSPQLFKKPGRSQCTWTINIQGGKKVKLWFDALKLDGDSIFVRDGNDSSGNLLAMVKSDDYDTPIVSSGSSMYLHYYHVGKWINGTRRGFTASYSAEAGPPTKLVGMRSRSLGSAEISFLAIFVVGIFVMGGLLLVVFVKLRRQHTLPPSSGSSTTSESTLRSTGTPSPLEDEASSNEPLKGGDRNARRKPSKAKHDRKRRHKERRERNNERICENNPIPRCACAHTGFESGSGSNSLSDGSPQRRNSGVYRTLERTIEECDCPRCIRQHRDYYHHEHFGSPEKKYYGDWMLTETFNEPVFVEDLRPGNYRKSFPQYV